MRKFLYNSASLPDLPEYEGARPYDMIVRLSAAGDYILFRSDKRFRILEAEGTEVIGLPGDAAVVAYSCPEGGSQWRETDSGFDPHPDALYVYMNPEQYTFVWTITDIRREDGTGKYYGRVPIAEALPETDRNKSFLTGLATGLTGKTLVLNSGQQEVS